MFTALGGLFVRVLAGFWVTVTSRTLRGIYSGELFVAPRRRGERHVGAAALWPAGPNT